MLRDNHLHTKFSGDSDADPILMIEAAKAKGLSGITFTDHLDWDYAHEPHLFDLDIEGYLKEMRALQKEYSDSSFKISVGIELGLQPHLAEKHKSLLSDYEFDFVIGSIHQINGEDPYYDSFWDGRDIQSAYDEYFRCTLDNLKSFSDIDTLGHLDYISRYGIRYAKEHNKNGALIFKEHADTIIPVLDFLIEHDIALEVNTGSFRYGYDEPNPSYDIIKKYLDMGGNYLTLGADAHKPDDVAIGFDTIPDWVRDHLLS